MELILILCALVALFFAYRQGKLAGLVESFKAAELKVEQEVKAKAPGWIGNIENVFNKKPGSVVETPKVATLADVLAELKRVREEMQTLRAKSGSA